MCFFTEELQNQYANDIGATVIVRLSLQIPTQWEGGEGGLESFRHFNYRPRDQLEHFNWKPKAGGNLATFFFPFFSLIFFYFLFGYVFYFIYFIHILVPIGTVFLILL